MKENEKQLISLCQKGEWENFSPLYDYYVRKIYKFIYFKVKHQENTEDLVSTVFFKAVSALPKFDTESSYFSAWLYKIAKNVVADYYRFKREESGLDDVWRLKADEDTEKDIEDKEKKEEIKKALKKLKPKQREVVILRVWHELSYKEIAQIIKKEESNAKMIFCRAVKNLKYEIPFSLFIYLLISATK
jgi:RNA polymerase sigma factor (sigma-70 family)